MIPSSPTGTGEVLKLGPPCSGEVIIKVDPALTGSAFAAGTETLLPGAQIPVHRHLHQDEVLFVHKGQGRALLDGRSTTVVPGAMLYAPRQAWHGLRNTGTGNLQISWVAAPPGLEVFFRELSRLGSNPEAMAMQDVARRHGIEFRPDADVTERAPSGRQRRHRRGGARGHPPRPATAPQPAQGQRPSAVASLPAVPPLPSGGAATVQPTPGRRRRRGRRGRSGRGMVPGGPPAVAPRSGSAAQPAPREQPKAGQGPQGREGRQRRGRAHRAGRVKEVYMGGRWVKVSGEGPVIAPGHESEGRGKRGRDDDTPAGPLSVPL